MKKKPAKKTPPRRNAITARDAARRAGRAVAGAARATRQRLEQPAPPAWQDVLATAVAGGGAALLSSYAVRKGIDPKLAAAVMLTAGTAAAFQFEGSLRTAATSVAGAGAGQLVLAYMQEEALKELCTAMTKAAQKDAKPEPEPKELPAGRNNALPGSFEHRLALHSQLAEDAARFTDPEADLAYAYADAAA